MIYLGTLGWLLWVGLFIGLEINGFRKNNDAWPTLSQLVKWWELDHDRVNMFSFSTGQIQKSMFPVGIIGERGIATWTWRRWLVALGLPITAVILEFHWVWEIF